MYCLKCVQMYSSSSHSVAVGWFIATAAITASSLAVNWCCAQSDAVYGLMSASTSLRKAVASLRMTGAGILLWSVVAGVVDRASVAIMGGVECVRQRFAVAMLMMLHCNEDNVG